MKQASKVPSNGLTLCFQTFHQQHKALEMRWKQNDFRASNFLEVNTDALTENLSLANLAKWQVTRGVTSGSFNRRS